MKEYKDFAKYYDIFYQNKKYHKEVEFLKKLINKNSKILDVGCGTGIHASILENFEYNVDGLDLNKEMLDIARSRIKGNLYHQNILNMCLKEKYDVIISMFAVINHLANLNELESALLNLKNTLNPKGKIIIDLHNPQSSGKKVDEFNNIKRTMKWNYNKEKSIEYSKIIFEINNIKYEDSHTFRIFKIDEIDNICKKLGLKVENIYENYDINKKGSITSKNLQFIIVKI